MDPNELKDRIAKLGREQEANGSPPSPPGHGFRIPAAERAPEQEKGPRASTRQAMNEHKTEGQSPPPRQTKADEVEDWRLEMRGQGKGKSEAPPRRVEQRLSSAVKRFVVASHALFTPPRDILAEVREQYQVVLSLKTIESLNPAGHPANRRTLSPALLSLFDDTRAAYIEDVRAHGLAHQSHRLHLIGRMIDKAERAKDFSAIIKGLELAAREMGGQLTNVQRREVHGTMEHRHLSVEDAKAELATRLGHMIENQQLLPSPASPAVPPVEDADWSPVATATPTAPPPEG